MNAQSPRVPVGRVAGPDEIVATALLLVGDLTAHVRSSRVVVGGGVPLS
ncbi:hypothetical protein FHU40_003592 [Nocardioides soli]|uniref:SDR family oxidoreductase n=1 Tax=Nocardioides soli TaxID=1036020 RepID=A0A7W4Z1U4_9ACTN|nr:hypothetical protein [Nocardioides soli]